LAPGNIGGDRFLIGYLGEAQEAPSLLTAEVPDATVIAADPAHWNIAVSALIRAVIFDGLTLDHPPVNALLEVLAPIVRAEQAYARAMDATLNSIKPAPPRRSSSPPGPCRLATFSGGCRCCPCLPGSA
jgi:hypothetical protein